MNEKQRMLFIALFMFIFFIVVSIIDGWFTIPVFEQGEGWGKLPYWLLAMGIILSLTGFGLGFASLFGDWGGWSGEDYWAVLLLTVQSWILIMGGFLDMISATVQNYVRGRPLVWHYWESVAFRWGWLDPPRTHGVPTLTYLFSTALGYEGTVTLGLIIASAFSIVVVVLLWAIYYEYA